MKILSLSTKLTYDFEPRKSGENPANCPECAKDHKRRGAKPFSWNEEKETGYCQRCNAKFVKYKPYKTDKEYLAPVWKNKTELTEKLVKWFEGRMIKQSTLIKMKIYSDVEFMPQTLKEESVVCFPFFLDSKLVNIKYRDGAKNFKLVKDAELIFYNINAIKKAKEIIIVEGEIDCLSYMEVGFDNCISVPNGASARNVEYLDNHIDLFDSIEKIYIATDNDIKGIELREELIRRLGQEKCLIVNFKDCKDANEYLCKQGGLALSNTIKEAIEIPVSGIVNLTNHYDDIYTLFLKGMEKGCITGFETLDQLVTWELSRLAVITGIPGHGKSEFVDFIVVLLNIVNGWKAAYFSPENYPTKYHYAKLCSKITGKRFQNGYINKDEFENTFDYIEDNFSFIYPEDDLSFQSIIEKAKYLVKKKGIKVLVIDPYNKIEHLRDKGESETEYISRFLDKLTMFAKQYNVLIMLVAHPRKMDKTGTGEYSIPNLYDINGSANFYNKCDYGIVVYRDFQTVTTIVNVVKVKFKHLGDGGKIDLVYNFANGRYEKNKTSVEQFDNSNYLLHKAIESQNEESFQEIIDKTDIPF